MASFSYLWRNRAKFSMGSTNFFRAWVKRALLLGQVLEMNSRRTKLTRKGALIDERAEIGEIRADGNKRNLTVGSFSFLGQTRLALHDRITIGNYVCINDGVQLLTASHDVSDPQWDHKKSPIIIEDYAWIATNAIILPGVRIGKGAVVGAGAVVSKSVNDYEIAVGNPAVIIRKKRVETLNYNPCEFLAANRAWLIG